MTDHSPRLGLPYLAAAQAQKHITHNEALGLMDTLIHAACRSRSRIDQPAAPLEGEAYLIAPGASGADWAGREPGQIADYRDGGWRFAAPGEGWRVWVEDEALMLVRSGGAWRVLARSDAPALQFVPGGVGEVSIWRISETHAENPRLAVLSGVSADLLSLAAPEAGRFFDHRMENISFVRVWNIDKNPAEPAWLRAIPDASTLQVLDPAAISNWAAGEQIQLGDPESVTPGRCIALDISPMLLHRLGEVFAQKGLIVKASMTAASAGDRLDLTPSGEGGSFVITTQSVAPDLHSGHGVSLVACENASPVSDSNLVFLRETLEVSASLALISVLAILR